MIYLVRKKLFRSKEGMKQLYYAVQRTLQPRGGVTTEKLAQRMARRKGMGEGDVQSVLVDLPKYIEEALSEGESVTQRTWLLQPRHNKRGIRTSRRRDAGQGASFTHLLQTRSHVNRKATPEHGFLPLPAKQILPPRNATSRNAGARTGTDPK